MLEITFNGQHWYLSKDVNEQITKLQEKLSAKEYQYDKLSKQWHELYEKSYNADKQIAELENKVRTIVEIAQSDTKGFQNRIVELQEKLNLSEIRNTEYDKMLDTANGKIHRRNLQIADLKKKTAKESLLFVNTIIDNFNMVDLNSRNAHDVLNELKARINR